MDSGRAQHERGRLAKRPTPYALSLFAKFSKSGTQAFGGTRVRVDYRSDPSTGVGTKATKKQARSSDQESLIDVDFYRRGPLRTVSRSFNIPSCDLVLLCRLGFETLP